MKLRKIVLVAAVQIILAQAAFAVAGSQGLHGFSGSATMGTSSSTTQSMTVGVTMVGGAYSVTLAGTIDGDIVGSLAGAATPENPTTPDCLYTYTTSMRQGG